MEHLDDDRLVDRYRSGESRSFEVLVERHGKSLFNYILYMVGNRHQAEDIYQETFCRLLGALGRYRGEGRFRSFLYTIAGNCARDAQRKNRVKEGFIDDDPASGERLPTSRVDENPEAHLEQREQRRLLLKALETIAPPQRQVFLLHQVAGLSFREIAAIMNCSVNTALGRMHYAHQNLKKVLLGGGNEEMERAALLAGGGVPQ